VIALIVSVLIGVGLLAALYFLARRGNPPVEGSAQKLVEARQTLDMVQFGLLPRDLVERIFAAQDLEYVKRAAPPEIQRAFLRERKRIAIAWVGRLRTAFARLMRLHRTQARVYPHLSLQKEIGLALNFVALLAICRALQVVFLLRGPYAAPRMLGTATAAAARVCMISEESLAFLKAEPLEPLDDSAHGSAAV
jgi:hypothetical protein